MSFQNSEDYLLFYWAMAEYKSGMKGAATPTEIYDEFVAENAQMRVALGEKVKVAIFQKMVSICNRGAYLFYLLSFQKEILIYMYPKGWNFPKGILYILENWSEVTFGLETLQTLALSPNNTILTGE